MNVGHGTLAAPGLEPPPDRDPGRIGDGRIILALARAQPFDGAPEATPLEASHIKDDLIALSRVGVPYTPEMIDNALADLKAQGSPNSANVEALQKRYSAAIVRDLGVERGEMSELDALVAYLQRLGTQIDFKLYDDKANIR